MRDIPLPENVSSEVYRAFTAVQEALQDMDTPVYRDKASLNHLREGESAFYQNGNGLEWYVRAGRKLHSLTIGVDDRIAELEKTLGTEVNTLESNQSDTNYDIATKERLDDYAKGVDASADLYRFIGIDPPDNRIESQSERPLSPLERSVIEFVFGEDVLNPDNICIIVSEIIGDDTAVGTYWQADNRIRIAKKYLPNTSSEINGDSTVDNIDLLDPGNMEYLGIFVHEVTHRWQEVAIVFNLQDFVDRFTRPDRVYHFDESDLDDFPRLSKEQHASIFEVWFGIKWQLSHAPPDGTMIDITSAGEYEGVGAFDRYDRIANIPSEDYVERSFDEGHATVNVPKRFISHELAMELLDDLQPVIDQTRATSQLMFREDSKPTSPSSPSSGDNSNIISRSAPYITNVAELLKTRYESNDDTNALTDDLLEKLEDIDAGATAGSGGQITNELYDDDVAITTAGEWVTLSVAIPEEGDAEFIKVQLRVESETFDWFEVYLPDIRSRSAGTAGTVATSSQRVYIRDAPDLLNPVYFGRDSDDNLLFTIGEFGTDTTAVDPMSLHIREVVSGTATDEEGVSQNPDWDDIQNKPDLYSTTEIFNENVSVPAPLEWVELDVSYPDVADADVLLVDVDRKDSIRIRIATVLAKPAGTAGATLTTAQSVCKASNDLFNLIYLGRTSANHILFSTGDADGDDTPFSPNPLIVEQIDKQDED